MKNSFIPAVKDHNLDKVLPNDLALGNHLEKPERNRRGVGHGRVKGNVALWGIFLLSPSLPVGLMMA